MTELPELFDLRIKARALSFLFIAGAALAGLTLLGERRSLGALIERTPVFRTLDAWGRQGT